MIKFKHPKIRGIIIESKHRGYLIRVGCQEFIYSMGEEQELCEELLYYLKNPEEVEKEFYGEEKVEPPRDPNRVRLVDLGAGTSSEVAKAMREAMDRYTIRQPPSEDGDTDQLPPVSSEET